MPSDPNLGVLVSWWFIPGWLIRGASRPSLVLSLAFAVGALASPHVPLRGEEAVPGDRSVTFERGAGLAAGQIVEVAAGERKFLVLMLPNWDKLVPVMAFGLDPNKELPEDDWKGIRVDVGRSVAGLEIMIGKMISVQGTVVENVEDGSESIVITRFKGMAGSPVRSSPEREGN